ncbi:MAG: 50S ribosomal protein L2 [Patescibacteria group bacterium]|nr:50S ribosomal protein L2 [Patescibacteria group bacterium]MCL5432464.1 50S ribosomal protein L2 [Patescibacteria group bacterium]
MLKKRGGSLATRFMTGLNFRTTLTGVAPEKSLLRILPKTTGRDSSGHISSRHQGGRNKRFYRLIDFKRDKLGVVGRVVSVEYDPNRTVNICLVHYTDGEKRYILHPEGLVVGDTVLAGQEAEVKTGNALPMGKIPVGTAVHNVELTAGRGGQIVRGAGTSATILAKEGDYVKISLPSGQFRLVNQTNFATVGVLDNIEWKNVHFGKAGRKRHMGIRPKVRGTAQNPRTHPHGGGEGRSGEGLKQAKTPWGKPARGKKTRKKVRYSNKFIVHG